MAQDISYYLITDLGSTTTKAILIDNRSAKPRILGIKHAETTVEAPSNDVRYGVIEAVKQLQTELGIPILAATASPPRSGGFQSSDDSFGKLTYETSPEDISFQPGIKYLTTSSAGGGLQILVVGLTLFDSASSAKRAAFGAGGIILDVFAIDDKRTAAEQMMAMRNLHPDMILLCGGTDGGAISGVLRLAEILRIAKPLPKFVTSEKIPTIYAGNQEAAEMVKSMISEDFILTVLPNLRPKMDVENLKPTQDMIQKLFMENVMERAPGYGALKKHVDGEILPTPMGVLTSLINGTEGNKRNFFAFDIGGATTDVFSYIKGHYQRTVSANLGMSYSALNVLAESGIEALHKDLPKDFTEDEIRNYIGNKTLYPTFCPTKSRELRIEQSIAKQAIRLALRQHQDMHYNGKKVGFLEAKKRNEVDAFESYFEYEAMEAKLHFYPSEIDVLIGAGGVFSHAENPMQSAAILIDAFDAHGITELWIDKDFVTPHLGVLAKQEPELSKHLLEESCIQKLALHIRPHFNPKNKKAVLKVSYTENGNKQELNLMPETVIWLDKPVLREFIITPQNKSVVGVSSEPVSFSSELPVIFDTRYDTSCSAVILEKALGIPQPAALDENLSHSFTSVVNPFSGEFYKVVSLPYKGDIMFSPGDIVEPDSIVAINNFNPPRLFIVQAYDGVDNVDEALVRSTIEVQIGDKVEFDTILRHLDAKPSRKWIGQVFKSPVRGKVEFINYAHGIVVLSEIQDYSSRPVTVKYAELLFQQARKANAYLKKQVGDFVYQGETLAMRMDSAKTILVHAPTTGSITEIDRQNGTLTIQYNINPHAYKAHVKGQVHEAVENSSITIKYKGTRLDAKLGLGRRCHGEFINVTEKNLSDLSFVTDKVVAVNFIPDKYYINQLIAAKAVAIVCPGMKQADLLNVLGKELGVINTGNEELPLNIIMTEAFGAERFSASTRALFMQQQGKLCHVEPHTRIRAGVARPYLCFL